jgi:hypothetical protein
MWRSPRELADSFDLGNRTVDGTGYMATRSEPAVKSGCSFDQRTGSAKVRLTVRHTTAAIQLPASAPEGGPMGQEQHYPCSALMP